MNLPDFLIIGAARCGTSSMHRNLLIHPQIQGPNITRIKGNQKEIHFFDKKYGKGMEYYHECFSHKKPDCLIFESTPNYLFDPKVPILARKHLKDSKFIIMLRNPIDRAWSHWFHWQNRTGHPMSELMNRKSEYLRKGLYLEQIKRWHGYFDKKQFLIIRSEDFYVNDRAVIYAVFEWLGVKPYVISQTAYYDPKRSNLKKKRHYEAMPGEYRQWMYKFYKPHNAQLGDYFGHDFGW